MNTIKSKNNKKLKQYKSYGEIVVKEAKREIEEEKKKGYMRFRCDIPAISMKKTLKMEF